MATQEKHIQDCKERLIKDGVVKEITPALEELIIKVNKLMDQFAFFPTPTTITTHRKFLHHREGIAFFKTRYGYLGGLIAAYHVMLDCGGYIPKAIEYYTYGVDEFGFPL